MHPTTQFAFKEWAVVCAALSNGRQSLILRKGGIQEGHDGFRVEHSEFWLFPTKFHQSRDEVVPEAWPLLEELSSRDEFPDHGLNSYAVVEDVYHLLDRSVLTRLSGRHVLSETTIDQRFHYRSPGLFVLVVRVYCQPMVFKIADSPYLAGCKSWVELPKSLPTSELRPVLDDAIFEQQRSEIRQLLAGSLAGYSTRP